MANATAEADTLWTPERVRGLGVRTDLRTACNVIGIGESVGYRMAKRGTFPVPLIKVGRNYVVPVARLLELLGIDVAPAA
ncbi:DNA-binding protein [Pseudofrankia sp. BMG5.37]|uniref:DNA-binding protein n=1 Tax=Pseudofrankia sp. BMG5.37 TaxID=3050035 RepID=UPI00289593B0|nr:DNA-binding protein [Pseudofrankia sp. BMG5.37]MDT3441298.1 DNA-binding protein [Pseudofrankia sp. BMG5.37]